jgi:6-phosphogluconate dehydrogenase
MAIQENGIIFNNLSRVGIGSPFNNVVNGDIQNESDLKDYIDTGEEYRNIQSVLIDWNGANLGSYIINTTGQLLSH